jgi:murein DD-endopeptidase MepM/ murein hydrolase activator NlpD
MDSRKQTELDTLLGGPRRRRWILVVAAGVGVLALLGVILALALGGGDSSSSRAPREATGGEDPPLPPLGSEAAEDPPLPPLGSRPTPTPAPARAGTAARPAPLRRPPTASEARTAGADPGTAPAGDNAAPRPAAPALPRTPEGHLLARGEITAGTAVITALKRYGVSTAQTLALLKGLEGKFDFRRARPGHRFELHLEPGTRRPVYLRYRVSLSEVYEVRPASRGTGYEGRKVPIEIRKVVRGFAGTITSSLGAALVAQGAEAGLTARVADVLVAQPRFFKEQRAGDVFRVLVQEQRVQGQHLRWGPVLALDYQGARSGRLRLYYFRPGRGQADYYDDRGVSRPRSWLHTPVHYTRMSSPFGMRLHPILKRNILHAGVDLVAPTGTPVRATLAGKVRSVGRRGGYGKLVVLEHGDGLKSYYAHLSRYARGLKKGQKVRKKQVIGYVGSTGRSTGPHLHFGLKKGGKFVDPLAYRVRPGRPVPARYRATLRRISRQRRRRMQRLVVWPLSDVPAYVPKQVLDLATEEHL